MIWTRHKSQQSTRSHHGKNVLTLPLSRLEDQSERFRHYHATKTCDKSQSGAQQRSNHRITSGHKTHGDDDDDRDDCGDDDDDR